MRRWTGALLSAGLCVACGRGAPAPVEVSPPDVPAPPFVSEPPVEVTPREPSSPVTPPPPPAAEEGPRRPSPWLRASFYAGVAPRGLAVGDFNEDGALDVAVNAGGRNYTSQYVMRRGELLVLLNDGAGRLSLAAAPLPQWSGGRILSADVDADGHLDLLVATLSGMGVHWGTGTGAFERRAPWLGSAGIISSMGLWSVGSSRPALWALGNSGDDLDARSTMASFALLRPEAPGEWSGLQMQREDGTPMMRLLDGGQAPAVADFNEDGLPDVATNAPSDSPWSSAWSANVMLSTAWGVLQPAGVFPRERHFLRVLAADFNRDGHLDVLGLGARALELYLGDGHGDFSGGGTWSLGSPAEDAVVVDFDGDGREDIVTLHASTSELGLWRGLGNGLLAFHGRLGVGRGPSDVAVADLDGDGQRELWVAEAEDNRVSAYAPPPEPEPGPLAPLGCPLRPKPGAVPVEVTVSPLASVQVGAVAQSRLPLSQRQGVGDFDGDGRRDLALAQRGAIRLVLQVGAGTFLTRDVPDTEAVLALAAGDLDGDGLTDLAMTSAEGPWQGEWQGYWKGELAASVLWNDAQGLFRERTSYGSGRHEPLIGDLNGDGRLDLVVPYSGPCTGRVSRFTHLEARTFREERLTDYNPEPDDACPGVSAPLAGDFDGDGTLDVVHSTLGININPTARDGSSLPGHGFVGSLGSRSSWAVDADGDGRLDLVRQSPRTGIQFFRGDGHATFQAPFLCPLPSDGQLFAWEDVDGDGLADVMGASPEGEDFWVGLGTGQGQWRPLHYALGGPVEWARAVDLMGDSRPELVVLMRSGELRVYPTPGS